MKAENWIKVEDKLPSHGTNVLVLIESHESHDYVRFSHFKNGVFYEQDGSKIDNVEYWRNNI